LLRLRDLRLLLVAFAISSLGDVIALVALTIRVHDISRSAWAVSALLVANLLPLLIFAPVSGVIVDRVETRRLLWITALLQAAIAAALAMLHSLGAILALSFALGLGESLTAPGLFALLPRIVGEDHTTEANAYQQVAHYAGGLAGPFVAGTLAATAGTRSAMLFDAGTFLLLAVAVALLRARREPGPSSRGPGRAAAAEGIRFLARDRLVALVVGVVALMVAFAAIDNVANVFFAKDVLGAGDAGYGVLSGTWIVGMVIAVIVARRTRSGSLATVSLSAALVTSLMIALAGAVARYPVAIAAYLVGGAGNGADNVAMRSLLHRRVPDPMRGRAFAAYSAVLSAAQLGATGLGGAAVSLLGPRGAIVVAGAGGALVAMAGLLVYRALPSSDREVR